MSTSVKLDPQDDPIVLVQQARALLGTDDDRPRTALEVDIRRAFKLVWPDLLRIEEERRKKTELNYVEFLGGQMHDKVAAITFLARHKLLDVTTGPAQALDTADARADLSLCIEILAHLNAIEALGILYDFCNQQGQARPAEFWQKACTYYLHLIARAANARPRALQFLKDRPHARRHVEMMIASADAGIAATFRALGEDYVRARKEAEATPPAPPAYLELYRKYNAQLPDESLLGLSSLLAAEERIRRAVAAGDLQTVLIWMAQGSPRAVRLAFRVPAATLPTSGYIELLEKLLLREDLPLETLAAGVVELGEANRTMQPEGGTEQINNILAGFAITHADRLRGVAKLAVRELRSTNAFNHVLTVMERTSLIEVAEEGLQMMCEMRKLTMAENVVHRRPILNLAYQQAYRYMNTVQELVSAAWGCTSEATAHVYMERLKELRAIPELEQLGKKHKHVSDLANRTLTQLRLEESTARRA
ncbi:MAG: hypothetical protein ACYDCO_11510 [Armatimonadota bacterium]